MKKRIRFFGIFAAMLMLAGCGEDHNGATYATKSAYAGDVAENSSWADEYDMEYYEEAPMADAAVNGGSAAYGDPAPEVAENAQSSKRKLIRNVSMSIETKAFDDLLIHLEQRTKELGGYVESSYSYNGSVYSGQGRKRSASMRIRIPADKLDEYLNDVNSVANVTSRNENVSDVTLTYVDMESHRNALRAEEEQLMAMMEKAETIEDLITIESRLSDIRYQLESMESQLRTYDNLVDYSTLSLDITEVEDLTPVVEQSAWEKMGSGFMNSLSSIGRGFKNFGIGVVMNLPYILLWAVIILVIFLVSKAFIKKMIRKAGYGQKPAVNGTGTTAMAQASSGQLNATGTMETVAQEKALNQTEVTAPVQDNGKKDEKAPEGETTAEEKK